MPPVGNASHFTLGHPGLFLDGYAGPSTSVRLGELLEPVSSYRP